MFGKAWTQVRSQWAGFLALFLVVAGGGAWAAFDPIGSDGDIDACFQKKSGDLDIRKGKKCGRGEKTVVWSVEGPQGAEGPQGPAGADGAEGAAGSQGAPGSDASNVVFAGSDSNLSSATINILAPSGESAPLSSGLIAPRDMESAAVPVRARDLRVEVSTPPGAGDSWDFSLKSGETNTQLTCTVANTAASCDSGAQVISIPAGGQVFFLADPSGTPAAATVDFAWRAIP